MIHNDNIQNVYVYIYMYICVVYIYIDIYTHRHAARTPAGGLVRGRIEGAGGACNICLMIHYVS